MNTVQIFIKKKKQAAEAGLSNVMEVIYKTWEYLQLDSYRLLYQA